MPPVPEKVLDRRRDFSLEGSFAAAETSGELERNFLAGEKKKLTDRVGKRRRASRAGERRTVP